MERSNVPKSKLYPNRFKKVVLSFSEPDLYGLYTFLVYKVQLSSFKNKVVEAGGKLHFEDEKTVHYRFEGDGCVVAVHNLALPHIYKH